MINFISNHPQTVFIIFLLVFLILLVWICWLTWQMMNYIKDKKEILQQAKKRGLENILEEQSKQIKRAETDIRELYSINDELSKISAKSITKVSLVRYNPFQDTGGDQSFSIALLDADNSGFVISALYSREGTRVYAKPIEKGKSRYQLTGEEIKAIEQAQG